jgi:hypothetical protein
MLTREEERSSQNLASHFDIVEWLTLWAAVTMAMIVTVETVWYWWFGNTPGKDALAFCGLFGSILAFIVEWKKAPPVVPRPQSSD